MNNRLRFTDGLRAAIPVIIGYLPAGVTFGILANTAQVRLGDLIGFSSVVFAGASQYMAINLLQTGAAYVEIIIATFLLNFRHFLMSASLSQRTAEKRGHVLAAVAYWITDETFSVASAEPRILTSAYLAGLGFLSWLSWNAGSLIGYLAGRYLPERIGAAMGVALYALFAALLAPQLKRRIGWAAFAAIAAGLNYLFNNPGFFGKGWAFVLSIVAAAAIGAAVLTIAERVRGEEA